MCVAGADQRRDNKGPDVEDVQPNFGEVRRRFERLSLSSLIEVKKKVHPSSQRQSVTSLSPNLQRQEKATNVAKLVEVRKTCDHDKQPSSESVKCEGRVRELVRMMDPSKGRISILDRTIYTLLLYVYKP